MGLKAKLFMVFLGFVLAYHLVLHFVASGNDYAVFFFGLMFAPFFFIPAAIFGFIFIFAGIYGIMNPDQHVEERHFDPEDEEVVEKKYQAVLKKMRSKKSAKALIHDVSNSKE